VGFARQYLDERYRLIRRCASACGADVFVAHDTLLEREVAIRCVRDDADDRDAQIDRLRRDAAALAGVDSPHVAGVLDLRLGDDAYLVLQRPGGPTLADLASTGPVTAERVVRWTGQLLDGLTALHARRLVHRDLRGEDVVVTRDTNGHAADAPVEGRVVIGGAIGIRPGPAADPRADVFRAGLLMLHLATGVDPASLARPCAAAFDDLVERAPAPLRRVARAALGLDVPYASAAAMRTALAR
jgi:serine/threonine-protein kinase